MDFSNEINVTPSIILSIYNRYNLVNFQDAYKYTNVGIVYKDIYDDLSTFLKIKNDIEYDIVNLSDIYNFDGAYSFSYKLNKPIKKLSKRRNNKILNILGDSIIKIYIGDKLNIHINYFTYLLHKIKAD